MLVSRTRNGPTQILICLVLVYYVTRTSGDLCDNYDWDQDFFHQRSTPKGGTSAGTYLKAPNAESVTECFQRCCEMPECNIALQANTTCFLISCNKTNPEGCEPKTRTSPKFDKYYMMIIRPWDQKSTSIYDQSTPNSLLASTTFGGVRPDGLEDILRKECDLKSNDCGQHAKCNLTFSDPGLAFICQCEKGYIHVAGVKGCVEDIENIKPGQQSCEYGLRECPENEECVPKNDRSKSGRCECIKGYVRTPETEQCQKDPKGSVPAAPVALSTDPEVLQKSTLSSSKPTSVSPTKRSSPLLTLAGDKRSDSSTVSPTLSTTLKSTVQPLIVSAGESKVLQLPKDDVTLSAYVSPKDTEGSYKYEWILQERPDNSQIGEMTGIHTSTLKLSQLVAGTYTFKIIVTADGKYGEGFVNVTVQPPARKNKLPMVQIKPANQSVNQPNDVVLDGSGSIDDDEISKYNWEMGSSPLGTPPISEDDASKATLVIKGLNPGKYRFKLTVTDSNGASNFTFANVTVIKEVDYPPKADAGSNVILSLPQNSVVLKGNSSTDDKGIASYEWIKKSDEKLAVGMSGVRTPFLTLKNLEVGDYTFTLKVTDTAGQTNEADIHVFVKKEENKPPVAKVAVEKIVRLPVDTVVLDGSNSTDDVKITSYTWTQTGGPSDSTIKNSDRAVATATGLVEGQYAFSLTVMDEEKKHTQGTVRVIVKPDTNVAPKAVAGGDKVVNLPLNIVTLDGSKSSDDKAIVSYSWTREEKSLAAGRVLNNSDHQAVLQLADLIAGKYVFTLRVTDAEGLSNSNSASVTVKQDEHVNDLVEMKLDKPFRDMTHGQQKSIENNLSLMLHKPTTEGNTYIRTESLQEDQLSGRVIMKFYCEVVLNDVHTVQEGREVVQHLKRMFKAKSDLLDIKVISLDTVVCQNNCSGHGQCDQFTKHCSCEAFWMENFIKAYLGDKESNCDWSILYVIIILFLIVITVAAITWGVICLCKRWQRCRPKKRHRYTLLQAGDDSEPEIKKNGKFELKPKGKYQGTSIMMTDTDFSSDEETLFIQKNKKNGHPKNGLVRPQRNIIKT